MTRLYLVLNITDMRKAISEYGTKSELKIIDEIDVRSSRSPTPPNIDTARRTNAMTVEAALGSAENVRQNALH